MLVVKLTPPRGEQKSPARAAADRGHIPSNPSPDHGRAPNTGPETPPITGSRPKPENMARPATRTQHLTSGRAGKAVPGEAHEFRTTRTTDPGSIRKTSGPVERLRLTKTRNQTSRDAARRRTMPTNPGTKSKRRENRTPTQRPRPPRKQQAVHGALPPRGATPPDTTHSQPPRHQLKRRSPARPSRTHPHRTRRVSPRNPYPRQPFRFQTHQPSPSFRTRDYQTH